MMESDDVRKIIEWFAKRINQKKAFSAVLFIEDETNGACAVYQGGKDADFMSPVAASMSCDDDDMIAKAVFSLMDDDMLDSMESIIREIRMARDGEQEDTSSFKCGECSLFDEIERRFGRCPYCTAAFDGDETTASVSGDVKGCRYFERK